MKIKGQARPPSQRRPGELVTYGFVPEEESGGRPGLDAPREAFQASLKEMAEVRDALGMDPRDPTEHVLGLDPLAMSSGGRMVTVLKDRPEVAAESGVDVPRFEGRLRRFHAFRRVVSGRRVLQGCIKDSRQVQGTVARRRCDDVLKVVRAVVAAGGPAGFARYGLDINEETYLDLCRWARPVIELADEIAKERGLVQKQGLKENQRSDEKVKKAQAKTELLKHILKMNSSEDFNVDEVEETVRLYDEVHQEAEKDRRGAGRG